MAAVTRWVRYDVTASGYAGEGDGQSCIGTRGYSLATGSVGDTISIGANDRLYFSIDGGSAPYITVYSGSSLDPRFIARDITEKIHNLGKSDPSFDQAQCIWENNKLKLYSGRLGSSSSASVDNSATPYNAASSLGWSSKTEVGGSATTNQALSPTLTVSGNYNGLFDEMYRVVISSFQTIGTPTKGGSNTYGGTMTAGGVYNDTSGSDLDHLYTIEIDCTNGYTMGAGTGNVPRMRWTSDGGDDETSWVELLYPDYWYYVGSYGVMVKFTDAVFNTVANAWTIQCTNPDYAQGANTAAEPGTALFIWGSTRGDDSTTPSATSSTSLVRVGTRGVKVKWNSSNVLTKGDEYYVICTGPQPAAYDITSLNYGNVTVSTQSPVKCVIFEIISGAIELSTVRWGLQSHGSFSHHDTGNSDTEFHFGTVGPGNNGGNSPEDGIEFYSNVTASDIDSDTPPSFLYGTKQDLAVVADADNSETVGSSPYMGMVADPIWSCIKLGASEVSQNSTINYRVYFDFS